jgi:hypothetical protein
VNLIRPIRITPPRSPHIAVERIGPAWSPRVFLSAPLKIGSHYAVWQDLLAVSG